MKIGFQVIFFVLLLNICSGLLYEAGVPGTSDTNILSGIGDLEDYETEFNATTLIKPDPSLIDTVMIYTGNVWVAINILWKAISTVVWGFPHLMAQIGYQITDPSARAVFTSISGVLYIAFSFIIFAWVFQLLSGRQVED